MRANGRKAGQLRPISLEVNASKHAEGSCLARFGDTHVLCTASLENRVPPHVLGTGAGWVTAEYGMLPRSTNERMAREAARGKQGGRTLEIQRLIGRALRASIDLAALGPRTLTIDCDVIQADGGTRCAGITGACVALAMALAKLSRDGKIPRWPLRETVAAVSVGICAGQAVLDLAYEEDSEADVDCNVVGTASGAFVEIQGTAERRPFSEEQLTELLALARKGLKKLRELQAEALAPHVEGIDVS